VQLVSHGIIPTIIERGKCVEERGKSIGALFRRKSLDPNSNLCYGEGGAGTWSDGKLTTRIGKNSAEVKRFFQWLVDFGAPPDILINNKPHLGTDRLVRLLKCVRAFLLAKGVKFCFDTKVKDILLSSAREVQGVVVEKVGCEEVVKEEVMQCDKVILAIGHSARSMYERLDALGVTLQAKPFAAGLRIEHPQHLIDTIQYGATVATQCERGKGKVPVADYRLATQVQQQHQQHQAVGVRSCFSFCMCPGGQIVPTACHTDELCINGMSFSRRQSDFANAALVVNIEPTDVCSTLADNCTSSALAGIAWQRQFERRAAQFGGGQLVVPVQRATDFLQGHVSGKKPIQSSYRLGVREAPCHTLFPPFVTEAIRQALTEFNRAMPGFLCDEAILHGVETRTSAPVQIVRHAASLESVNTPGLFPAGEGAGYAGGIVSAAVDGMRIADVIAHGVCELDSAH